MNREKLNACAQAFPERISPHAKNISPNASEGIHTLGTHHAVVEKAATIVIAKRI